MPKLRHLAPFVFLVLAACSAAPEESAESETEAVSPAKPLFVKNAVNVDRAFSDAVKVSAEALVIPTAKLGKIAIGSIVAGDRASKGSDNPYGFLRKVTAIETKAGVTTLKTERAELSDWLYAGKIDFSSTKSLFEQGIVTTGPTTRTLKLQDDHEAGEAAGAATVPYDTEFGPTMSISNASFTLAAKFDGYFEVQREEIDWLPDPPTGVRFRSHLTLDPLLTADIHIGVKAEVSHEQEWLGPTVLIPLGGPIPITLRFGPAAKCHISATGELGFTVGASLGAHLAVGFEGSATWTTFDMKNLSEAPSMKGSLTPKSVEGNATISTGCELGIEPELLVFDAIGISGTMGPYYELSGTQCAAGSETGTKRGFTVMEEHGLQEALNGRVQIPVFGNGKDFELTTFKQPTESDGTIEHYFIGDEKTCEAPAADTCEGKSDGFHCSEELGYSGIVCQSGQILSGLQCDPSQKCTGGDASHIECQ